MKAERGRKLNVGFPIGKTTIDRETWTKRREVQKETNRGVLQKKLRFETYLPVGSNFGGWYVLEENYIMKKDVNVSTSPNVPTGGYVSKRNLFRNTPQVSLFVCHPALSNGRHFTATSFPLRHPLIDGERQRDALLQL